MLVPMAPGQQHTAQLHLPVVHMCDGRGPVAEDPGLDVHGPGLGVGYSHIHHPLQALAFITWDGEKHKRHQRDIQDYGGVSVIGQTD